MLIRYVSRISYYNLNNNNFIHHLNTNKIYILRQLALRGRLYSKQMFTQSNNIIYINEMKM